MEEEKEYTQRDMNRNNFHSWLLGFMMGSLFGILFLTVTERTLGDKAKHDPPPTVQR